jgi:hypothetical protein
MGAVIPLKTAEQRQYLKHKLSSLQEKWTAIQKDELPNTELALGKSVRSTLAAIAFTLAAGVAAYGGFAYEPDLDKVRRQAAEHCDEIAKIFTVPVTPVHLANCETTESARIAKSDTTISKHFGTLAAGLSFGGALYTIISIDSFYLRRRDLEAVKKKLSGTRKNLKSVEKELCIF